jgi:transcriptional regulator with XRE-family HTH domain
VKRSSTLSAKEIKCLKVFGTRIRTARLQRGWTLEDAEEQGWKSWQHLQQIETGSKNINLTTLIKLLEFLDLKAETALKDLSI